MIPNSASRFRSGYLKMKSQHSSAGDLARHPLAQSLGEGAGG
jgi:hypothetical protein